MGRILFWLTLGRVGLQELITIEFDKGEGGLGFSIAGGNDDESGASTDDPGIYIVQVIYRHGCGARHPSW